MPKSTLIRTETLTVPVDGDSGEVMVFEVRGLGAAMASELIGAVEKKDRAQVYEICLTKGVVKIVSGIENEKGEVPAVAAANLADLLSLKEADSVVNKVMELSRLLPEQKKT